MSRRQTPSWTRAVRLMGGAVAVAAMPVPALAQERGGLELGHAPDMVAARQRDLR